MIRQSWERNQGVMAKLRIIGAAPLLAAFALVRLGKPTHLGCPQCLTGVNLYNYPPSVAEACGYTVTPINSRVARPDGGTKFTYSMPGGLTVIAIQPPANFDPLTASDSELSAYGYQVRPTDPSAVPKWAARVSATTYLLHDRSSFPVALSGSVEDRDS